VIDDSEGKTLLSVQTFGKKKVAAKDVATRVAEKLKEKKLERVVFDRSGNKYTGVLKNLADNIREQGIRI
jgi:large subunit ribosomal protein L18